MKKMMVLVLGVVAGVAAFAGNAFRVTPYVQHPKPDAMSILWFCDTAGTATLSWWKAGAEESTALSAQVTGAEAPALGIEKNHVALPAQYKFSHRLTGLEADTAYNYKVVLAGEGGATYANAFRTAPTAFRPVRFVAYSDSETQTAPKTGSWEDPTVDQDDGSKAGSRKYYVSKEEGFASNVCAMAALKPDFVAVAGDLAGEGSDQDNWDQYWKHYAGALNDCAGATPILAAPGNHDYNGYDINSDFGEMGMGKYLTYFEYEPNTANVDADQKQRFHRLDYGPVAVIFIDPNNGPNYDPANTYDKWANEYAKPNDRDTNQCMTEDVCRAPDFNPGSEQYKWIEEQLADAQTNKLFTFLVCHQCPYSIGYHGRKNSETGLIGGEGEYLSGVPTRCYTNLIFKYGVDGWICGHDEICEHSRLTGVEKLPDGTEKPTEVHVYDVGYGGDDLRGARRTSEPNPYEVFRAHVDAPEVYDANGTLVSGGKHYGHLEVNVETNELGQWVCKLQQNYVFISKNAQTGALTFDTRTYPDVVVLTNTTYKAAPPAPPAKLDYDYYVSEDGNDANDGRTPETAFASLAQAVSVADDDESIYVAEGTYATTGTVAIAKKLTIVGAGRDATIFRGGKVNHRAFSLTADGALLRDFSILGYSNTLFAAGCGVNMTGGTLDNVRIGWIRQGEGQGGAAPAVGSGLYMSGGTVTNCVIDHCLAWGSYGNTSGCGVYVSGGTIVDSTISYNARQRTQVDGSGIRIAGSSVKVIRCLINGNNSGGNISNDTRGMGVYMDQNALVEDCVIRDNGIQGVWMSNGTLRNCLIAGHSNSSESRASGVHMEGSAKLYNCTIWGNSAKNANAGLRMDGGTAVNNIVAGNGTLGNAGVTKGTFNTNVVCTSSSIAATTAVGNFRADPLLKDPANGDFSLTLASVALDAGAPIVGIDHDLAFVARPQGVAPDIGAYELQLAGGELQCAVVVGESAFKEGAAAAVTSRVLGGSGSYTYQWYVDDQLTDQTSESPVFEGLGLGRHTVRLVVSDGTTAASSEVADAVTLKPSTVYVDLEGGNEFPYNTSDTAAQNIHDAFDAVWCAAGDPGHVIIAEGTYPLTKCIIVSDPCVIVGAGRDLTTLDGKAISGDRGLKLGGSGTLLKDLTVTACKNKLQGTAIMMGSGVTLDNVRVMKNEREKNSGAVGTGISMSGGTVTNCLIDANTAHADYDGTKGIGVYMSGGLLVDSVICSNKFDRNQHSGVGVCVEDGTVRRCRIFQNCSSVNDGNTRAHGLNVSGANTIVEDCLIYSNGWNGVQINNGTVRNCVIFGHKANTSGDHWAGVYIKDGKLQNGTLYDNVASKDTTGKSGLYQTGGTVENCIIWASAASESLGGCSVTSGTFRNNISDKTIARGTDCVVADPQFVDAAAGDFHLQSSSPAVDKGRTISPFETDAEGSPVDIEGIVRPQKDAWDIGAYEYVPGKDPVVSVVALQVDFPLGGRLEAVANTENVDTNTATFAWTLRDQAGETVVTQGGTGGEFVSFAYDSQDVGVFTLSLTVTVDDQPIEAGNTVDFTVKPTETFVATTGSNEFPYDSWETAATNLNDAVSGMWMANDSTGVVHVAAGDYKLKGAITLNTPLRVLGAGRDETVIHGKYGDRGFYLSHKDAVLADLTLTGCTNSLSWVGSGVRMEKGLLRNVRITKTWIDGHSGSAAASGLYLSGGVVTNCLIDANASNAGYGTTAGMGVYMTGGTLVDSVVCSNWVNRGELEGIGIRMTGGTVRRCDIFRNKGYAAGDSHGMNLLASAENVASVIEDCRIHDGLSGVQAWGGNVTFRNCLIYGHNYTLGTSAGLITADGTKVYNCTIAGNTCTQEDRGDASFWNGTTVKNTIACSAVTGETAKVTFSCFNQPVAFKRGYRLKGNGNPCVNAGDNSVWNGIAEPKDLDGRPRILEKVVDLGCFEHEPTGFSLIVR